MAEPLTDILYVEDEPDIREVARMALEMVGGFKVTVCESGHEALSKVEAAKPQLILLDVMMPGIDGPTTFKSLRQLPCAATIPIIFMTAKVQPQEVQGYMDMGAIGVIRKPFDPMTLCDAIKELWNEHGKS